MNADLKFMPHYITTLRRLSSTTQWLRQPTRAQQLIIKLNAKLKDRILEIISKSELTQPEVHT